MEPRKDDAWAWVVASGVFIVMAVVIAYTRNAGLFFVAIQEETGASSTEVAWISTCYNIVQQLFTPVAVALSRRYGTRPLVMTGGLLMAIGLVASHLLDDVLSYVLTLGVVTGLGAACCVTPAVVVLSDHFERHIGFATSFVFAGCSIGHMAFAPLLVALFRSYGVSGALLITGGILMQVVVAGALFFPTRIELSIEAIAESEESQAMNPPSCNDRDHRDVEDSPEPPSSTSTVLKKLFRNASFYALALTCCCEVFVYLATYKYIPSRAKDLNIPDEHMGYIFSVSCIVDIPCRLLIGPLVDLKWVRTTLKRYRLTAAGLLLMAANELLLSLTESRIVVSVCTVVHVVATGIYYTTFSVIVRDLLGDELYPMAYGVINMSPVVMTPADSLLLAHLRDVTGSFRTTFIVLAVVALVGALSLLGQKWIVRPDKRTERASNIEVS